jgi:hypothetical protein
VGTRRAAMILAAENVVDLQFFLMDSARYYAATAGTGTGASDELLANAAALDYALLLSSQHGDEAIDDDSAVGISVRETMTKAACAALDFVAVMLRAPDDVFDDFVERHVRVGGLFETIAALRERGAAAGDDLAFRTLTLANDLIERRLRR